MVLRCEWSIRGAMLGVALLVLPVPAFAQMDETDAVVRVEQLENQLRQLTGQNEQLQYRNRQLEDQLRQLQQGQPPAAAVQPNAQGPAAAAAMPRQSAPQYQQPQYQQPPAGQPAVQQAAVPQQAPAGRPGRRSDAFDPNANPNAPGAPRALGGAPGPVMTPEGDNVGAPGGRAPGEPLDLSNPNVPRQAAGYPQDGAPPSAMPRDGSVLATAPPTQSPRDEFDLGYGYLLHKDYALGEQTMRNFMQKYPSDRLIPEAQYWLGESLFQQQRYRDAAESFLNVTTKFDTSAKAPDALLRLGQSLAALKEKEASCAALGEVTRKYPKASTGVKQGVAREQKRVGC